MLIKRVSTKEEVHGIKLLQSANLRKNLSPEEAQREGFVTAEYTLEFLEHMNRIEPSVIATEAGVVVGYALVATKALLGRHELLDDLFTQIDGFDFKGSSLREEKYVVVGQLCVAKSHRGLGVAKKMYVHFRSSLHRQFNCCLTDVQVSNPRSIRAHLQSGFEILGELTYGGEPWKIVIWDWRNEQK